MNLFLSKQDEDRNNTNVSFSCQSVSILSIPPYQSDSYNRFFRSILSDSFQKGSSHICYSFTKKTQVDDKYNSHRVKNFLVGVFSPISPHRSNLYFFPPTYASSSTCQNNTQNNTKNVMFSNIEVVC